MTTKKKRRKRLSSDTRLFLFTDRDEYDIDLAIERARAYMETYGQGTRPKSIDTRHYTNIEEPQEPQTD